MRAFHYGLNGGPHTHRPWSALRHRHKRRPASRDWRSAQHWRASRSEHAMAFAQCTMKHRNGEETLAYVKECDAESGDGAPLYTQHGRVERFSSGYWEYREVPASCAQGPREAREAPRQPPAPFELLLPMASLESAPPPPCGPSPHTSYAMLDVRDDLAFRVLSLVLTEGSGAVL